MASLSQDYDLYELFQKSVESAPFTTVRDIMEPISDRTPIPLEEVESVDDIMRRFCTGGNYAN